MVKTITAVYDNRSVPARESRFSSWKEAMEFKDSIEKEIQNNWQKVRGTMLASWPTFVSYKDNEANNYK